MLPLISSTLLSANGFAATKSIAMSNAASTGSPPEPRSKMFTYDENAKHPDEAGLQTVQASNPGNLPMPYSRAKACALLPPAQELHWEAVC